jgi:hypothetical protein
MMAEDRDVPTIVRDLMAGGYAVQHFHYHGVLMTCAATATDTRLIELGSRAAYPEVSR